MQPRVVRRLKPMHRVHRMRWAITQIRYVLQGIPKPVMEHLPTCEHKGLYQDRQPQYRPYNLGVLLTKVDNRVA